MKYLVMEIQTNTDGTINVPPVTTFDKYSDAQTNYYSALAVAVASSFIEHTVCMLNSEGRLIDKQCFKHVTVETVEEPVIESDFVNTVDSSVESDDEIVESESGGDEIEVMPRYSDEEEIVPTN